MAEKVGGLPGERNSEGKNIYVESMEKSVESKFNEIAPWVKPGVIIDAAAGAGPLEIPLGEKFTDSKIIAVDIAPDMVDRLKNRFKGKPNIEVVRANVRDYVPSEKADTILHISTLHEVHSANGRSHLPVMQTLRNDWNNLKEGGRLIIRDGVQPPPETVFVKPISQFGAERFPIFVKGFGSVRNVEFKIGEEGNDLKWHELKGADTRHLLGSLIRMHSQDVSELLSKYFYSEVNLPIELKEQFGIWTLEEYKEVLKGLGFSILHAETFILDYLLKEHYSKDYEIFHLVNGVLSNAPYPPSTMLLVGEK